MEGPNYRLPLTIAAVAAAVVAAAAAAAKGKAQSARTAMPHRGLHPSCMRYALLIGNLEDACIIYWLLEVNPNKSSLQSGVESGAGVCECVCFYFFP